MAKKYAIDEITDGMKGIMPILRAHLRSQAGFEPSTAMIDIDRTISGYKESVFEYHPSLRGAFSDVENALATWLSRASQAKPEDRRAYAPGLDAIERKIDNLQTVAGLAERDEARQAKRA